MPVSRAPYLVQTQIFSLLFSLLGLVIDNSVWHVFLTFIITNDIVKRVNAANLS